MRALIALSAALLVARLALVATLAEAQERAEVSTSQPVVLSADRLSHDQRTETITAIGNVEITQGNRILIADKVIYRQSDGKVTAEGNVALLEPSGEVIYSQSTELTDSMQNGVINQLRVLLSDKSRLYAENAVRTEGNRTELSNASYSACNLCPVDPNAAPMWQIKAESIVHDQEAKSVVYHNAWFEVFGVPIAYTPYFRHADPTAKRKTGLLTPSVSSDKILGYTVEAPYYFTIGESADLVVTPRFTSKEGGQLSLDYKQITQKGELAFDGSITQVDQRTSDNVLTGDKEIRGHVRGDGRFRINDEYKWGFNVFRASDDTYLRRYDVSDSNYNSLNSRLYVEGIGERSYTGVNALAFQDLQPGNDPGADPLALPMAEYNWVGNQDRLGGHFGFDGSLLGLHRPKGADTRRASATGSWIFPFSSPIGDRYTFTAQMRGDVYWVNEGTLGSNPQVARENDVTGRVLPLAALDWRYPFVNHAENFDFIIEPQASLVVTPRGGNKDNIPNEDSLSVEFDDSNLFSLNRFPGLDRYEEGPRLNYGMRFAAHGYGGFSEVMVGQVLRPVEDDNFARGTGLIQQKSDYVARATISPTGYIYIMDRIRIDQDSLEPRRHEVVAGLGPSSFRVAVNYANLDKSLFTDELRNREAIGGSINVKLTRNFSVSGSHLRDLAIGASLRDFAAFRFTNECLDGLVFVERAHFTDRDIEPSTTFGVRLQLDNLS
jgi:LPS-assembly protein